MITEFTDIGIVDLDLKKTTWSRVHSSMRTLYLGLSRVPDLAWTRFFHEERESRIVIKRHGLWIEDGYIVFDCLLADVEKHHLPDFRLSIAYANRKSHELVTAQKHRREESHHNTRAEQRRLLQLREHIRDEQEPATDTEAASAGSDGLALAMAPALPLADGNGSGVAARVERGQDLPGADQSALDHAGMARGLDASGADAIVLDHAGLDQGGLNRSGLDPIALEGNAFEHGAFALDVSAHAGIDLGNINLSETDVFGDEQGSADPAPIPSGSLAPAERESGDLERKSNEWRARFRAARPVVTEESDGGND